MTRILLFLHSAPKTLRVALRATALMTGSVLSVVASRPPPLRFQFDQEAFNQKIQQPLLNHLPVLTFPKIKTTSAAIDAYFPGKNPVRTPVFWSRCGGGFAGRLNLASRVMKLPDDPTPVLAAGYRDCRHIDISFLDLRVPVKSYPADYFGDFVYEQWLVTSRMRFSDEASLRKIFMLLAGAAIAVEDEWQWWLDEPAPNMTVSDFRNLTGFQPELLVEMVGDSTVRIEINFSDQQVLIRSGDHWEIYALDVHTATMLESIALAEQTRMRSAREEEVATSDPGAI